ncbi:testis-specific Y-encoded protein 4-like [Ochotona curzoniae]|uniref:testis-specific Y-encoded protein 4-like n=1 Tax=Ochotona curzoniae TaxID=130825 RepID=UPI001B348909|nr:testis-specific Y-encoded protein 4-like [Ochotona curzoniae]
MAGRAGAGHVANSVHGACCVVVESTGQQGQPRSKGLMASGEQSGHCGAAMRAHGLVGVSSRAEAGQVPEPPLERQPGALLSGVAVVASSAAVAASLGHASAVMEPRQEQQQHLEPCQDRARSASEEEVLLEREDVAAEVELESIGYEQKEEVSEEDFAAEELRREEARWGSRPAWEQLQLLQLELSLVNSRGRRACALLRRQVQQNDETHQRRRRAILQDIPGFWPQVVQEFSFPKEHCRIELSFRRNPYFKNEVLVKVYDQTGMGYRASQSTAIRWLREHEAERGGCRTHLRGHCFSDWLLGRSVPGSSKFARIICEDLWLNPLHYYPAEVGMCSGNRRRAR